MADIQRVHHELSTNGNIRIMWKPNTILLPLGIVKLFKFAFTFKYPPITKRTIPNSTILEKMIAEAAYYRAGQRGFSDGNDIFDWLEAEKEILERFGDLRGI